MISDFAMIASGLALRFVTQPFYEKYISVYPHFKTPLIDMRELKEMIFTYEHYGTFYLHSKQIGQSELLLHAIYKLQGVIPLEQTLQVLYAITFLCSFFIVKKLSGKNWIALFWLAFSPISILGGSL